MLIFSKDEPEKKLNNGSRADIREKKVFSRLENLKIVPLLLQVVFQLLCCSCTNGVFNECLKRNNR